MSRQIVLATLVITALGGFGGWAASILHMPMPWLSGALITGAAIVRLAPHRLPANYRFPTPLRLPFIAIIGLTIGLQVKADLLSQWATLLFSLAAITVFVPLAQFGNYWLFRRVGGFDRPTAFFSGAPGGLMEAILMGEERGADMGRLTLQQFLRIIVVITTIPLAMSIWVGHPVGSAAGLSGQMPESSLTLLPTLAILGLAGALGLLLGTRTALPAGQLTGPLLVAAGLNFLPLPPVAVPVAALVAAQVVLGVSLGTRFFGLSGRMVVNGLWLAALSVAFMLGLGGGLAWAVTRATGLGFDTMLISFAPGGVTEMGLIAITLAASPAVVALHHIYRIVLTVILMAAMARRVGITPVPTSPSE